ncbi:MAG: hypothetical protein IJU86_03620 [Firmicutes bacterium]|nr:hypothetical protein [Bacillota bacterium]
MNENKFDLKNIITVDNVKDSYSYKTSKGILKNFFGKQFETECRYSDKNDDEVDCYVFLTDGEYNCLNDLCCLLTINIEDYLPMRCSNNTRDIIYHCSENLPDRYFHYTDFNKLRNCIVEELTNRKLIQFNFGKKTFRVTVEDYFKIITQLSCFIQSYASQKTYAINILEIFLKRKAFHKINDMKRKRIDTNKLKERIQRLNKLKFLSDLKNTADIVNKENAKNDLKILFKRNIFYKISDTMQKVVPIDKVKNGVEHLAKLKFLSMLKSTTQTVKNTQAIHKLDLVIKRNVFHKINNVWLKQKNIEQESQISIQEHDKNKEDNKPKKSLRKKLIIGSCITLILSLVILYFNLVVGIIRFAIGVCVLIIYGICKSKSNKIQGNPKILLKVPIDTNTTQTLDNYIIKSQEINNVPEVQDDTLQNSLNSEI